jgi:TP901 family phage tail tape measure protein
MANNDGTLKFDTKIDSTGFARGVQSIGSSTTKILGGVATGITALGGAAIKVGSDFEAGMSQVQAISGASGEDLEKLKEKAKEMGASTKFSATESAEALNYMAMAGWKTEDMLGGIEGIMNLAAASGEDLAATSDIVTDAMTAFGLAADGTSKVMENGILKDVPNATHFADILAAASSNANTNVGMMGETFKYVAPLAGSLGYSAEDTATAIGLMANAGIKGSQAGTSLRSIMTRLAKPTKESQMAMDALGLSITDSSGKMKPLSEIVGDMRQGFAGLTEDEKATYAAMLGGQEAMSGLLAIVNASDADFEKLSGAINNCNGSAAEMAEIMQDNLPGQITNLQSKLEGLGVSLYETMQDTAKDVVKEAQGMVQQLQDAFNEGGFEGLVSSFGNVLAQIVQRIAEAAPTVIDSAVNLVMSFCDGLRSAPGIGESGASLITAIVTGLMVCVDEIWSTAIVLVGKLAEGIAAGAPQMIQAASGALLNVMECIVDWLPDILQAGADIIVALVEGIAGAVPTLIYQAAVIITEMAMALIENIPALIDAAIELVKGLVQGLIDGMPVLLEGSIQAFMAIVEALPEVIEQLLQALPDLITAVIDFFTQNIPMIIDGSIRLLMGIIQAIPAIVQAIVDNFPQIILAIVNGLLNGLGELWNTACGVGIEIVDGIGAPLSGLADKVWIWLAETVNKIALWGNEMLTAADEAVNSVINSIINFFAGLPEQIAYWLGYVLGTMLKWGVELLNWVITEVPQIIDSIVTLFSELPGKVWTWLVNTVTKVVQWGQQMFVTATNAVQTTISNIISLISQLPSKVWTWLVNVVTKVIQWGPQMLTAAKTAISNMISSVISLLSELPGKVVSELEKVTSGMVEWGLEIVGKMTEVGKNIVEGIWNGISNGWDWLVDSVKGLADSLLQGAKDALGIHSPSKRFRDEFGRWLMPGTMEGVKRSMPQTLRDMKEQAGELLAAMKGTVDASMNEIAWNVSGAAGALLLTTAGTTVYNDNSMKQENNYHVPVASPAETNKAQREAFRKFAGGVK